MQVPTAEDFKRLENKIDALTALISAQPAQAKPYPEWISTADAMKILNIKSRTTFAVFRLNKGLIPRQGIKGHEYKYESVINAR